MIRAKPDKDFTPEDMVINLEVQLNKANNDIKELVKDFSKTLDVMESMIPLTVCNDYLKEQWIKVIVMQNSALSIFKGDV